MKIGLYQHSSVASAEVAAKVASLGLKVAYRNANYFNERETEKFDHIVVDGGRNEGAVTTAYTAARIPVSTVADFLDWTSEKLAAMGKKPAPATPASAPTPEAQAVSLGAKVAYRNPNSFNPDSPRGGKKPGKKQGEAAAPAPEKQGE